MRRECSHIVPCESEASCKELEEKCIARIKERNKHWSRSVWGNLPDWMRLTYVAGNLRDALAGVDMAALRSVLGEERFRLLLNAAERAGCFVSETETLPPVVLP